MTPQDLPPLPEAFLQRLEQIILPERLPGVLRSFTVAKPTAFRVNTLAAEVSAAKGELEGQGLELRPLPWCQGGFTVEASERRRLTESAACVEGRVYVQNPSSMVVPLLLGPKPGETVLDLAAAPGGKTLHMAAMMANTGRLSAVEPVRSRYYRLTENLRRCGATIVTCYRHDGRSVGRKCPGMFDRALLDAPCSSEARFTRLDPNSWAHWTPRKIRETSRKQKGLLRSAVRSLKPGGILVYCTCSFAPEENEQVIHSQLRRFGDALEILPVSLPFANVQPGLVRWSGRDLQPDLARSVRILPDDLMDALYICKLAKRDQTP